jgi:hypothetical protein
MFPGGSKILFLSMYSTVSPLRNHFYQLLHLLPVCLHNPGGPDGPDGPVAHRFVELERLVRILSVDSQGGFGYKKILIVFVFAKKDRNRPNQTWSSRSF